LSWADTWTTDYSHSHNWAATVNAATPQPAAGAFNHPAVMYQAQTAGFLNEMTDSVFFSNAHTAAYTESNARGVTTAGGSNPAKNNVVATASPIQSIARGAAVTRGGKTMLPVTFVNPLAANDSLVSAGTAPNDGFYTPANYRGAFGANDNWMSGWTAAAAYGMTNSTSVAIPASTSNTVWNLFE
jgi:hypothetical protein